MNSKQLLGNEYDQKKKKFMGKFAKDVKRVWEHYTMHMNAISG